MPLKMILAQAIVISDQVYIGGGIAESEAEQFRVCKFDPVKNEWSTLPPAPVKWFGVGQLNGKLVLVGGMLENDTRTADVHVFEDSQQWEKSIPAMPSARSVTTVLSHSNSLIVCGGNEAGGLRATIFVYCGLTSQWSSAGSLPSACYRPSAVVMHNHSIIAGGYYGIYSHQQRKSVASLILPSSSVVQIWPDMPHYDSSIAAIGGSILAIGGASKVAPINLLVSSITFRTTATVYKKSTSSEVYAYCPTTSSWIHIGDLPAPRNRVATATLPSGELLVMGGGNRESNFSNSVFMGSIKVIA